MNKIEYRNYLKSEHWKTLRDKKVTDCYRCFMCHSEEKLALHHLTYNNLGMEKDGDTVVLCSRCHFKVHFGSKKFRHKLKKKHKKMLRFRLNPPQEYRFYITKREWEEYRTMIDLEYT